MHIQISRIDTHFKLRMPNDDLLSKILCVSDGTPYLDGFPRKFLAMTQLTYRAASLSHKRHWAFKYWYIDIITQKSALLPYFLSLECTLLLLDSRIQRLRDGRLPANNIQREPCCVFPVQ